MGINLSSTEPVTNNLGAPAPAPAPTPAPAPGFSLNLTKGTTLDLTKRNPGLSKINVGVGWDVAVSGPEFDLDVSAFLLKGNGKISSGNDVVFFNNKVQPGISLLGDNRTGAGEGDDETITVDLSQVAPDVSKIVFCVNIYDAVNRRQTFGMINNSYIRLLDAANGDKELCIFQLRDSFSTETAVVFAELVRNGSEWDFKALGDGKQADLNGLAALFQ